MTRFLHSLRAALEHRAAAPVLLVGAMVFYAYWIIGRIDPAETIDFFVYYIAAAAFSAGENVYAFTEGNFAAWAQRLDVPSFTSPYYYPPLTALIVWPLTLLSPMTASVTWLALSAGAFVGAACLLGRSSAHAFGPALALAMLVAFTPVTGTLVLGQVNGFLLLWLCAGLYCASRGQWRLAGAALALGALTKVVPLAHIALVGWQRRLAATASAGLALALGGLASMPLVGSNFLGGAEVMGVVNRLGDTRIANQALSSWIFRAIADPGLARATWVLAVAAVLLVTVLSCARRPSSIPRFRLEFALVTAAITLIMPYTFVHQFVVVLIPLFVLLEHAIAEPRWRWMVFPLVPLAAVCSASNVNAFHIPELTDAYLALCLTCWGMLVLALKTDAIESRCENA